MEKPQFVQNLLRGGIVIPNMGVDAGNIAGRKSVIDRVTGRLCYDPPSREGRFQTVAKFRVGNGNRTVHRAIKQDGPNEPLACMGFATAKPMGRIRRPRPTAKLAHHIPLRRHGMNDVKVAFVQVAVGQVKHCGPSKPIWSVPSFARAPFHWWPFAVLGPSAYRQSQVSTKPDVMPRCQYCAPTQVFPRFDQNTTSQSPLTPLTPLS